MPQKQLTWEQQNRINQVIATIKIENMPITQQAYENLVALETGEKTVEEIIADITKRHAHNE